MVLVAGCGSSPPTTTSQLGRVERVTVARVPDGDTLRLTDGRKVRIVQIDAPELETDCYGQRARRTLLRITPPGARVLLERDPVLDAVDRYGRVLRYVVVGGADVGLTLVAEGAAEPYFFHNDRGRHAAELLRAATRARSARRGLWGACPGARLDPGIGSVTGPA